MKKSRPSRRRRRQIASGRAARRNSLTFESLESRQMLTTVVFNDPPFIGFPSSLVIESDPGVNDNYAIFSNVDFELIIINPSAEFEIIGDADGFAVGTTINDNDTLTIAADVVVDFFTLNTGDGDDGVSIITNGSTGMLGDLSTVGSLTVNSTSGDNTIDLTGLFSDTIVDVFTGDGNDTVSGSFDDNFISVGDGNNVVSGGGGDDTIIAGAGNDMLAGGAGDDDITAGPGNDTLDGEDGDDTLSGGSEGDSLFGGFGDDTLIGGTGFDTIDGGLGNDVASYVDSATNVVANLFEDGTGTGVADGFTENFISIEGLGGSQFDDVLNAFGDVDNQIFGFDGDDFIFTENGTDVIGGGFGSDTITFAPLLSGVNAVLGDSTPGPFSHANGGGTINAVENIIGTNFNDVFNGNSAVNLIEGGLGNDILSGGGDSDTLLGGSGDDQIVGGAGDDIIVGGFGADSISGSDGDDQIIADGQIDVTFVNLQPTDGALLTPIFAATQNGFYDFFDLGQVASAGLESFVEDGDVAQRIENAIASGGVGEAVAVPGGSLAPGEVRTVTFFASPFDNNTQFLSFAAGLVPSNDAFVGNDSPTEIDLFDDDGNLIQRSGSNSIVVTGSEVLDAGTEINDEIPANTRGLDQSVPGTGDDEFGIVGLHPGFIDGGNILTLFPGADFTLPGAEILGISIESSPVNENGFSFSIDNQPLTSISTAESSIVLLNEAIAGNFYIELDTTAFPGGAVRGQLTPVSEVLDDGIRTLVFEAVLTSDQVVGGSNSLGGAVATVTFVADGDVVNYSASLSIEGVTVDQLEPNGAESPIRLFNAPVGEDGLIVIDLVQDAGGDLDGNTADGSSIFTTSFESNDDTIIGGAGDDSIAAGFGNDTVFGGLGDDIILGDAGDDLLVGQAGDDQIIGGAGNDNLNGGPGVDVLLGQSGDDFLVDGSVGDTVDGGVGSDFASFQSLDQGAEIILGPSGQVTATFGLSSVTFAGIENVLATNFADTITVNSDVDSQIFGLNGDDTILGGGGNDTIVGGGGSDRLLGLSGDDNLFGGFGNDIINGGPGADNLIGDAGNDFLLGFTGADFVNGGQGNDQISFQGNTAGVNISFNEQGIGSASSVDGTEFFNGVETISGSEFADTISAGGTIGRTIFGLGGDDTITGTDGDDFIIGGAGNDSLRGQGGNDILFGEIGNDLLLGGLGDDFVRGDAGDDEIFGNEGDDQLVGGTGNDVLAGQAGLDFIFAGEGNDELFGGDGEDELRGGLGDDLLIGGLDEDLLIDFEGDNTLFQ